MKNNLLLFAVNIFCYIILSPSLVYSQKNKTEFGLEVGPNLTNIEGNSVFNRKSKARFGYYLGLNFQYNLSERYSIKSALVFEQKGSYQDRELLILDANNNIIADRLQSKESYNYLIIPLLFKAHFGKKIKLFINTGPYMGLLLSHKIIREKGKIISAYTGNHSAYFKNIDLGIAGGAGLLYPINKTLNINLEIRQNNGVLNINNFYVAEYSPIKTSSTNFLLGLNYFF